MSPAVLQELLGVDTDGYLKEFESLNEFFAEYAPRVPSALLGEQQRIIRELEASARKAA
jgi:GTP-dependent phosphoenolpyruvate carboxykinase